MAIEQAQQGVLSLTELMTLAERLLGKNETASAIKLYQVWIAHTESALSYAAFFNLGAIMINTGDVHGAEQAFRQSVSLKPDFAQARLNLGLTLERMGDTPGALEQWRSVLNFQKAADRDSYLSSLNNLGRLLLTRNELPEAEEMLERSLILQPDQPEVLQQWVNLRKKQQKWPAYDGKPLSILIYAPDYRENSAGIVVLHKLCHLLNLAGHHATVSTQARAPQYLYDDVAYTHEAVAILPDVAKSSDCLNEKAVRWVLLFPGALGQGDTSYEEELIFTYIPTYYPSAPEFFISSLDTELFTNKNQQRTIPLAKYIGKFVDDNQYPDIPLITRTWPESRQGLADFLNTVETLVCYDPFTALSTEAALCGCKVIGPDAKPFVPDLRESDPVTILTDAIRNKWGL